MHNIWTMVGLNDVMANNWEVLDDVWFDFHTGRRHALVVESQYPDWPPLVALTRAGKGR